MSSISKTVRNFFADKNDTIVIWQPPNALLWAWILFTVMKYVFKQGSTHQITHVAASMALLIWSLLEIKDGASPFRRTLGVIVLIFIVVQWLR
jgi:hypothetical protein